MEFRRLTVTDSITKLSIACTPDINFVIHVPSNEFVLVLVSPVRTINAITIFWLWRH